MKNIVQRNTIKIYIYMVILTILIGGLGSIISSIFNFGLSGTGIFLIISGIINFVAYFYSDRLIIASSHAIQLNEKDAPEYFKIVKEVCREAKTPFPKLYYLNEEAMNAFATGRNPKRAAVVATRGLLEKLKPNEIKGVIAHELSHVKNLDTRVMAVIAILAGLISILADIYWRSYAFSKASEKDRSGTIMIVGLVLALITPISAMFIQLAISRKRECLADADAARLTKKPNFLASALRKIERDQLTLPSAGYASSHLYFTNPFKSDGFIERLFSTHPPIKERIALLENMKV